MDLGSDIPFLHRPGWLSAAEATALLAQLEGRRDWTQGSVRLFGREVPEPRLTFFEGDLGITYTYAHRRLEGRGWSPELAALRDRIRAEFGLDANTVLANLYRDGRDSMGWHRDNERELGHDPHVASLSLGEARDFDVRRDADSATPAADPLPRGPGPCGDGCAAARPLAHPAVSSTAFGLLCSPGAPLSTPSGSLLPNPPPLPPAVSVSAACICSSQALPFSSHSEQSRATSLLRTYSHAAM